MRVIHALKAYTGGAAVGALGMFDGVHAGHQMLIRTAVRLARAQGIQAVACTFDRHPMTVFAPERAPKPLLSREESLAKLEALGIDWVLLQPFTRELAETEPEEYLRTLVRELKLQTLVIGENHTFGRGGRGDVSMVRRLAPELGYTACVVPFVMDEGKIVSSTWLRTLLERGETRHVQSLLALEREESAPEERGGP